MREHIMMFVAEQLPRFRLKHSTCKTYSISRISGRGPWKTFPWPTGWETLP